MASVANYMTQPKVKTAQNDWNSQFNQQEQQNQQMQAKFDQARMAGASGKQLSGYAQTASAPSTLREVNGAQRTVTTYDQPKTQTPTVGTMPPALPGSNYPAGPTNPMPSTGSGGNNPGGWNLGPWNQATTTTMPNKNTPLGTNINGGATAVNQSNFFKGDPNIWNSDAFKSNDAQTPNYISSVLPVAQFDQNNYQYATDFNEAQRRWNAENALAQNQNSFQQSLSTRQQQSAEEQARIAANQWAQQFGWTQQTDQWNRDLSQQSINNQYAQGMDQNQATRDVASTYANSNMYQANQQLAGQKYQANQQLAGQLGSANIYANAQNYGADQQLAGQLGSAGLYSDAQRYQAQLGLQGQLGSAQLYSGAQRYEADQGLAQAGLYSQAQRYGSDQQLQGQLGSANIYSGAQRYQTDAERAIAAQQNALLYAQLQQQAQQAELERANQLQMANLNAYGRSAPVSANWSRSWA